MNPHRPRRKRRAGAALIFLDEWRQQVEYVERLTDQGGYLPNSDCPCCDGMPPDSEARRRLESLMRNGGRRAHRLRVAVSLLDERFREATMERRGWESQPWWERREPWD